MSARVKITLKDGRTYKVFADSLKIDQYGVYGGTVPPAGRVFVHDSHVASITPVLTLRDRLRGLRNRSERFALWGRK